MVDQLKQDFINVFGYEADAMYFAPGRVNLIGEHTDYNGGHVFPCSLDIGMYLLIKARKDQQFNFYSENFKHLGVIKVGMNLKNKKEDDWANYPKGVIKVLTDAGYSINHGFDLYFFGNIPNGAGLSSSASIEVAMAIMLNDQFDFNIDRVDLVKMCQEAENTFIGVNCGIMDQFAIGLGKAQHAILLDTNTLSYDYVPLTINGYKIVVSNTNKQRGLADSKYNERRSECEAALNTLKKHVKINSLGDLSIDEFNTYREHIKDDVIRKRAKHAVYENQRTIKAKQALHNGDLTLFGQLMNESHVSLRDDYEVTGKELDTLVSLAWNTDGVIGSRMTGAGFGGCTVSIVEEDKIESFKSTIEEKYNQMIGYKPSFYVVTIGDGAKRI